MGNLPPLPDKVQISKHIPSGYVILGYTADQMRKYAEAAVVAEGGWLPIATAPRDADIWVYGLATVWTSSRPFLWQGQAGWYDDDASWWTIAHDDKGEPLKVIPTHWMPLPAPPAPKE